MKGVCLFSNNHGKRDVVRRDRYFLKHLKPKTSTYTEIKNMVREFYMLEAASSNANDFVSYFNYPVTKYFNKKNVTKEYILKNKKRYNRDWPQKKYDIYKVEIIGEDKQMQTYSVKITFEYRLQNRNKSLKGVSSHLLTIKNSNGKLYIEKIIALK